MSKIRKFTPRAYQTPIGSPLSFDQEGPGGEGIVRPAHFRSWNGSTTYGVFNSPDTLGIGDTQRIGLVLASGGVAQNLNEYVQIDAGNLLQLTSCTATIDGTPVASGADASAYIDGKRHVMVITATASITPTYLGQNGAGAAFLSAGSVIMSVQSTVSGVLQPNYIIDNDSTSTTYARGEVAPSAKYITWTNFTASDIELFTYNNAAARWEGQEIVIDGSFDTACGVNWTCNAPATIAAGVAVWDGTQVANTDITQNIVMAQGARYLTKASVVSLSAGLFRFVCGGTIVGTNQDSVGTYSEVLTCGTNPLIYIRGNADFNGSVDNVSVKRVIEYV